MSVGSLLAGLFGGPSNIAQSMPSQGSQYMASQGQDSLVPSGSVAPEDILGGLHQISQDPAHPLHKGLFGQTGLLRDVMGIIGDSYLLQNGLKEQYAPTREQEKYADAISGFNTDPQGAIRNAMGVDAKAGNELMKTYSQAQSDAANAEHNRQLVQQQRASNLSSILYAGRGSPEAYAAARVEAMKYAQANGLDPSQIPESFDQGAIDRLAMSSVPVDKQADNAENYRSHTTNEGIQRDRNEVLRQAARGQLALGTGRLGVETALGIGRLGVDAANAGTSAANVGAKVGIAGMPARKGGKGPTAGKPTPATAVHVIPGVGVVPRNSRGTDDVGHIGGKAVYGDGKGGWTTTKK